MSVMKKFVKAALRRETKRIKKERRARRRGRHSLFARILLKIFGKLFTLFAAVYALLFTVFFFDLDGKLLYYVVEPLLVRHYDRMERKNPLEMPYEMKSE